MRCSSVVAILIVFLEVQSSFGHKKGRGNGNGNSRRHRIASMIQEVNSEFSSEDIEKSLLKPHRRTGRGKGTFQLYNQAEINQAKKLLKCIRKELAAQHQAEDPEDGGIIIDDVAMTPEDIDAEAWNFENCKKLRKNRNKRPRRPRQISIGRRLWPNHTLYYRFDKDFNDTEIRQRIRDALAEISETTCLIFSEIDPENPPEGFDSTVAIVSSDSSGCWSYLGKLKNDQVINLSKGCWGKGTIQHEFTHALGVHHEQTRQDRDDYVTINWENMKAGNEANFQKCTNCIARVDSIRLRIDHALRTAFNNGYGPTITPHDPEASVGQRSSMSPNDANRLQKLYCLDSNIDPCNPNPCQGSGVCIPAGTKHSCDCPDGVYGDSCEWSGGCNMTLHENRDMWNHNIKTHENVDSEDECCFHCEMKEDCNAFVYNLNNNKCYLKSKAVGNYNCNNICVGGVKEW